MYLNSSHPKKKKDPIIIPLFSKKAFWPLQDVPQLQNNIQLNNPPLFPSALPACCRSRWQNALNLSTKSPSSRLSRTHARIPTLAAADKHPEEIDEFEHHFRAGFGLPDAAFSCCKKKRQGRHTLGSDHPPSWFSAGD